MKKIDFNNKTFALVENSENGKVNSETIFKYQQQGNLVTADYYGGAITYGKIIATLKDDRLNMLYQCVTTDDVLKAGKAIAVISYFDEDKLKMSLDWEWLGKNGEGGKSEYIEID